MKRRYVVFVLNLLQDVNIIRPLAMLAASEMDVSVAFLVSDRFHIRDKQKVWGVEIDRLADEISAEVVVYDGVESAFHWLSLRYGALIAASESNLSAHHEVHNVFHIAPAGFVTVTLQHGFECVGFLQNREHDKAHGRNVRFGADIVAGWLDEDGMASMAPSEKPKLVVTGPGLVLQHSDVQRLPSAEGLICENLHSVRLSASGDFKASFMDVFFDFCEAVESDGKKVALRPHPGGQYVLKNKLSLPDNVVLANDPIYRTNLSGYRYGVSAPSSVIIDMVLAGLPTAVWRDQDGMMDTRHYDGLTMISSLDDWLAFRRDALDRPEMILDRQGRYLRGLGMPTEVEDVRRRFLDLMETASRRWPAPPPTRPVTAKAASRTRTRKDADGVSISKP
jgi:hypothetical protein